MPGESKLSVAGLPPGLTVGALLAAAALAVVAQLVCHRCGGMGAHAAQPLARRAVRSGPYTTSVVASSAPSAFLYELPTGSQPLYYYY